MKRSYTTIHILSIVAGLLCIAVDVGSNLEFIAEQTKTLLDSSAAAVVAVALGTALALAAARFAMLRQGAVLTAVMLFVGYLGGTAFSLSATLDRVATLRDNQLQARFEKDERWQDIKKRRDRLDYAASRECAKAGPSGNSRGPRCLAAEGEVLIAEDLLAKREGELDAMGKRIAAFLPGIATPQQVSLYQPCLLPVALLVLGQWLFAFGAAGHRVKPEFAIADHARNSIEGRARRLREEFIRVHGRPPKPAEIAQALNTTIAVSRRLAKVA